VTGGTISAALLQSRSEIYPVGDFFVGLVSKSVFMWSQYSYSKKSQLLLVLNFF
jgi:hypothetical protein